MWTLSPHMAINAVILLTSRDKTNHKQLEGDMSF